MKNIDDSNKIENLIFYLEHHLNADVLGLINLDENTEFTLSNPEINQKVYNILSKYDWNRIKKLVISYGPNSIFEYLHNFADKMKIEDVDEIIKNSDKYELTKTKLIDIISSTKNSKYIKECISNPDFLFDLTDKCYLACATHDTPFINRFILMNFTDLSQNEICKLIADTQDPAYIIKIISENKFKFSDRNTFKLISATNDKEYIKECIVPKNRYNLKAEDITYLAMQTEDTELIKHFIENKDSYSLNSSNCFELIMALKDTNYINKVLAESDRFHFSHEELLDLLIETQDINRIRNEVLLNHKFSDVERATAISKLLKNNPEHIEEYKEYIVNYEKYSISKKSIYTILKEINNPELITDVLKSHFVFNSIDDLELALYSNDKGAMKKVVSLYLANRKKNQAAQNRKNQKKGKASKNKRDLLSKKDIDLVAFILYFINDEKYKNKIYKQVNFKKKEYKRTMKVPPDMTVGIEIESIGLVSKEIEDRTKLLDGWNSKKEQTVKADNMFGVEITSPILKGSDENNTFQIQRICEMLRNSGQFSNETCGGHIHFGAKYLKTADAFKRLLEIWYNSERVIYTISNKAGEIPREFVVGYAIPLSNDFMYEFEDGKNDRIITEPDLIRMKSLLVTRQSVRYDGLNFRNMFNRNKETIECRIPNGTLDPDVWIENINLFGGIIASAQKVDELLNKKGRTPEDKQYLASYFKLINQQMTEEETLECLLALTIPVEDRSIYRERYRVNSELIKQDPKIEGIIKSNTYSGKISFEKLKQQIFSGESRVRGEEYTEVGTEISRQIEAIKSERNI